MGYFASKHNRTHRHWSLHIHGSDIPSTYFTFDNRIVPLFSYSIEAID